MGWIREATKERPRVQLILLTAGTVLFSVLTVYFWQRDLRSSEGREEAVHLVANLPCPEWGQRESEEIIGSTIAFFSRYSSEFPDLSEELRVLRAEIKSEIPQTSVGESFALSNRLERSASQARGMLLAAAGGPITNC